MGCAASTSDTSNGAKTSDEAESSQADQQQQPKQADAGLPSDSSHSSSRASPSTGSSTDNAAVGTSSGSSSGPGGGGNRRRSSAAFGSGSARSRRESNGMALIPEQDESEADDDQGDDEGDVADGSGSGGLGSPGSSLGGGGGHTSPRRGSSHPFAATDDEVRLLGDDPESMNHYHQATFCIPDDDPYYASPAAVRVVHRHSTSGSNSGPNGHRPESPVASSLKGSVSGKASPTCDALSESTMSESRKRVAFRVHSGDGPLSPGAAGRDGGDDDATTTNDDLAELLSPNADDDASNGNGNSKQ